MVEFGDARLAQRAVFTASWFGDVACSAGLEGAVEDVVVWVVVGVFGLGVEMVVGVGGGEVGENVGEGEGEGCRNQEVCWKAVGTVVEKKHGARCENREEEDLRWKC